MDNLREGGDGTLALRAPALNRRKVILVEKDGLLRESLGAALAHSQDPHLVGVFENIRAAHKAVPTLTPHVVIVGVPDTDDPEDMMTLLHLAKHFPQVGIVFLIGREEALPGRLQECLDHPGTAGRCFLRRQDITSLSTLLRVVDACAEGLMVFNPEFFYRSVGLRGQQPMHLTAGNEFRHLFSQRQREVLELMAQGLNNRTIADQLFVSERTVENHIYQIYHRLPDALRHPGYHLRVSTALCYLGLPLRAAPH